MNLNVKNPPHTIAALSTPRGEGAIGVIRLSGSDASEIVQPFFTKTIKSLEPNKVVFEKFTIAGRVLDEVLLTYFRGPRSFTGEDVIEISFHGSTYILGAAMEALVSAGAELAQPGEFTQRAFLNGKMDLSQAEAVADLIASESAAEHKLAMHQMRGGFSNDIAKLRDRLVHFASMIELELDFAEEDVEFADRNQLIGLITEIRAFISGLIDSFRLGNAIKNGVPIAIIGRPNAGKSTLLNTLLNEDRAIVSDIAGTTRDVIEDVVVINGVRMRFIDTAGIRQTNDRIEAIGVSKSLEKMKGAAIVLYIFDATDDINEHQKVLNELMAQLEPGRTSVIVVANKIDLLSDSAVPVLRDDVVQLGISAKQNTGVSALLKAIEHCLSLPQNAYTDTVVTNVRHLAALKSTDTALMQALEGVHSNLSGDLVAADIRDAMHHLGSITGQISTDELLGNIFSRFCIGK